ncbi:PREDICTED: UDP-glucuronosyltransferase 2B33-like [Nicrophorus vespilloides]|uniref:UDP-glucuronosyltransferase n=1 Tax=Nicrophorus vespilloides TaxID=110193 RepID=A0ABM1MLS0_NICVS|nr:PREDICTED: UDP-glucuronosyltransferase 2B33-like [Nicrophorus vespilloides]
MFRMNDKEKESASCTRRKSGKKLAVGLFLLLTASSADAARILGVFPTPSYSHQIVFLPIVKELAKRGHDVVVMTSDPMKENINNLKQINISFGYDLINKYNFSKTINENNKNPFKLINTFMQMLSEFSTTLLEYPEVQAIINNENEHFDLLMVEYLIPTFLAFKHRFNCSMIGLTSLDSPYHVHATVGNPVHAVLYPELNLPFQTQKLSFFERLISFMYVHFTNFCLYMEIIPAEEKTIAKYFGNNYPPLSELLDSLDMLFINVNYILHTIRPLTPATVAIGPFIHIKPPRKLPKDLKLFLDEAKEGVIYFSLGSNVKSKDIAPETRDVIMKTFANLPYKILWKFESESLPGKPDNVKLHKWVPQQDVLRHKNVKLFISQCGLQSSEEGIYSQVPILGLPFYADQVNNAYKLELNGLGLSLDYKEMTIKKFTLSINELINNITYKEKVKKISNILKDEPMSGLERAVWWTEYVLRNKGEQHLKGPAVDIPIYQYYYLDIITFFSLILFLLISVIYLSVRKCFKFVTKKIKSD